MSTQQDLFEAQQRLRQAQQEQQERARAAAEPQRQIAQAQADIAMLQKRSRHEAFAIGAENLKHWVGRVDEANGALIDALNQGDIRNAQALYDAALGVWGTMNDHRNAVLSNINADIQEAALAVADPDPYLANRYEEKRAGDRTAWQYEERTPDAYTVKFAVYAWIGEVRHPSVRRMRIGIAYGLTGEWFDPVPGYDPMQMYKAEMAQQRLGRH